MRPEIWWIIAPTLALWAALCGLLWHRFVVPVCCWPLVGSCWRHRHIDLPGPAGARVTTASESSGAVMPTAGTDESLYPLEMAWAAVGRVGEFHTEDDEWADQLHEINQLGKFGDLTRPVAQQTHYEVEYLIRQLGVPEWVPERLRAVA